MSTGRDQFTQRDPVDQYASPGSGDRTVTYPGITRELDARPDHGEGTYRGCGRLAGKKTIVHRRRFRYRSGGGACFRTRRS